MSTTTTKGLHSPFWTFTFFYCSAHSSMSSVFLFQTWIPLNCLGVLSYCILPLVYLSFYDCKIFKLITSLVSISHPSSSHLRCLIVISFITFSSLYNVSCFIILKYIYNLSRDICTVYM